MKIVFFEVEKWEEEYIKKSFPNQEVLLFSDKLDEKTIEKALDAEIISTFIYSILNKEILSKLPKLKFLTTRSTGFDHIDINFCKEKWIIVSNVPTYGVNTVAEHTFALILAISRKIIPSVERSKRGDFGLEGLRGMEIYGKTIGVVGVGHIGRRVVEIAASFGMKIIAFTKNPQKNQDLKKFDSLEFVSLDELLSSSDIITLHLPLTPETHHIINMENIGKIKNGAILINTARGGLIETQAILEALKSGVLGGAGIDVLEEECSLKEERELLTAEFLKSCDIKTQLLNHVLLTRENVVVTPHNAFNSKEALIQIIETTCENLKRFVDGKPQNIVSD
ncbi:MAG: hydroxyacid dehydrogenase [bacterium]|nr:hydroxyacid dehydrogenase [bacterium]